MLCQYDTRERSSLWLWLWERFPQLPLGRSQVPSITETSILGEVHLHARIKTVAGAGVRRGWKIPPVLGLQVVAMTTVLVAQDTATLIIHSEMSALHRGASSCWCNILKAICICALQHGVCEGMDFVLGRVGGRGAMWMWDEWWEAYCKFFCCFNIKEWWRSLSCESFFVKHRNTSDLS